MLTKQDFEALASALRKSRPQRGNRDFEAVAEHLQHELQMSAWRDVVNAIAVTCHLSNPRPEARNETCLYTMKGEPVCVVGHVVADLGLELSEFVQMGSVEAEAEHGDDSPFHVFDPEAIKLLIDVQTIADRTDGYEGEVSDAKVLHPRWSQALAQATGN